MKIIYLSTLFPARSENSNIYTDLIEEMVRRGHEITVITTEERKKGQKTRLLKERGCRVLRVKVGNLYDVNMIEKGISTVLLSRQLKCAIKKYIKEEAYNLVLFEAPPLTLSGAVRFVKKRYGAPAYLMMKDIFPQNAADIGVMKEGGLLYRYFEKQEERLYQTADKIGCMSRGNIKYLEKHSCAVRGKTELFPNTKRIKRKLPAIDKKAVRKEYEIEEDAVVFIFGGNMGKPQGMGYLCRVIHSMRREKRAYFILVGRGTEWGKVKEQIGHQKNVLLLSNLERNRYEDLVRACDVGIVSLDNRFTIPNYPSRILSYMEYGMPVLAATDRNTDFRELITESGCGKWNSSDSAEDLKANMEYLIEHEDERKTMGEKGRRYLEENFDVTRSADILESFLGL